MRWDLFCRVIDNYGDIGVCWRLAADLGARGEQVRLWVDDASALGWIAPDGAAGVQVLPWREPEARETPGDVVVEAFGCDPPPGFVARMKLGRPPVWVNLEYLSSEDYVERSHGLPSPQLSGPGAGLTKWFFYPGFTPRTGGLLREPGLMQRRQHFDRTAWLASRGIVARPDERVVSLFCYENPALPELLHLLGSAPTLLLLTPGPAQAGVDAALAEATGSNRLRTHRLPWLTQADYDRLLWSCDLNFVRGEDSFVRAQWAGVPFVWHIYPQHDGAHAAKLQAFLDRFLPPEGVSRLWLAWNGLGLWPRALPPSEPWVAACTQWRDALLAQDDLTTQLISFVRRKG